MDFDFDPVEKAVFEALPLSGAVTARAVAYNLAITEEEAARGLSELLHRGLVGLTDPLAYFLTAHGIERRSRRIRTLPG